MDNWTRAALDRYDELVKHLHEVRKRPVEIAQEEARVILLVGQLDKLGTQIGEASRRLQN